MALNDILSSLAAAWLDQQKTRIYGPKYKEEQSAARDASAQRQLALVELARKVRSAPEMEDLAQRMGESEITLRGAQGEEAQARAKSLLNPQPKRVPEPHVIEGMRDGKPVKIYRDPETGEERVEPQFVKPAGEGRPQLTIVTDAQGRIGGAWDPRHGRVIEAPEQVRQLGGRKSALPAAENARQASLKGMLQDTEDLITQARQHPDVAGGVLGYKGMISKSRRAITGADPTTNFIITTTKNLADQLLRARSGAQINEQEYKRLSQLVPRVDSPSFFDDLNRFHEEVKRTLELSTGTEMMGEERPAVRSTAPVAGGWKLLGTE